MRDPKARSVKIEETSGNYSQESSEDQNRTYYDFDIIKKEEPDDNFTVKVEENVLMPVKPTRRHPKPPKGSTSSKNIMKNYARALTNFAIMDLATPYLNDLLKGERISLKQFREFINQNKEKVNCIKNLRNLLLIDDGDDPELTSCKTVFQGISVVFIKYFSVNWVFSSRVSDKQTHLKYRFKILRRIRDPENFTYLEDFSKSK